MNLQDILFSGHSHDYWDKLCEYVPELAGNKDLPQNPKWHPEGTVDVHICLVIDNVASLHDLDMSLVALFHDIGKFAKHKVTNQDDGTIKISHAQHELASHDIIQNYKELIENIGGNFNKISNMVLNHMRTHLYVSGTMKNPNKREKFEKLLEFEELKTFAQADDMSKKKQNEEKTE